MFNLVITNYNQKILSAVYEGNRMMEASLEEKEASSIIGNIYVGRVERVVNSINAAFIEISRGMKGYYSLVDNTCHVFLNKKNTDKVCQGDLMLVQVERDGVKTKAPILSSSLNLSGKYVVLTNRLKGINISGKIKNRELIKVLKKALLPYHSDEYGLIARTNCEGLFSEEEDGFHFSQEALITEAKSLIREYRHILDTACTRTAFTLMKGSRTGYMDRIINARMEELQEIITDDRVVYQEIVSLNDDTVLKKLRYYDDDMLPLAKLYDIDSQITNALKEKIWLKSGGYLVIQPTEALTVIDVNTGKFISSKGDREAGFLKVNKEAAVEIARQIRLRNYSGIIIVDFIDMKEEGHNQKLLNVLSDEVTKDPVLTTVVDITRLGLVEITRKKIRKPLYEQL